MLAALLPEADEPLDQVDVAPAEPRGGVATNAGVSEDRQTEELLPALGRREHLLDLGARDRHHRNILWTESARPLNAQHRIRVDLVLEVEPREEPIQRAVNASDGRRRALDPLVQKRAA